jgi:hypothetical protein
MAEPCFGGDNAVQTTLAHDVPPTIYDSKVGLYKYVVNID